MVIIGIINNLKESTMKTNKFIFSTAILVALASCTQEALRETDEIKDKGLVEITLNAVSESEEETKVTFTSPYPALGWLKDDQISLLGVNTGNQPLTANAQGPSVSFSGYGSKNDGIYYAIYPYDSNVSVDENGTLSGVVLPAVQTATAGTFDPNAYVAIAKSEDKENLYFKGVGTFLKFDIEAFKGKTIKSITVMGNSTEVMAGKSNATKFNGNGGVDHSDIDNSTASYSVKLQGTFDTSQRYFMIVRPQPYEKGVTVYVELEDGKVLSRSGSKRLFESGQARNSILTLTLNPQYFSEVTDLYALYELGYDINVADEIVINKSTYPGAQLITKDSQTKNLKSGVFFVDADAGCSIGSGISDLVVIGRNIGTRTPLTKSNVSYLSATASDSDKLIMKNISYAGEIEAHHFQLNKTDIFEKIIFDDCYLGIYDSKALLEYGSDGRTMNDFIMKNCDCKVTSKGYIIRTRDTPIYNIILQNNVIFSDSQSVLHIVDYTGSNLTYISTLTIDNNTFYNVCAPGASQGYIRAQSVANLTVTDNLFYDCTRTNHSYIYYSSTSVTTPSASHNINSENSNTYRVYIVNGTVPSGVTNPTFTNWDFPLTTWNPSEGNYVISGAYQGDSYGATRQ